MPVPQSVAIARMFVRHQLISLRYADLVYNANQIVSELVTNAVTATAPRGGEKPGRIRLYLGPNRGRPLLEVWDSSPEPPRLRGLDLAGESGRGLHIVRSLAAEFGWAEERGGKTIWALLR